MGHLNTARARAPMFARRAALLAGIAALLGLAAAPARAADQPPAWAYQLPHDLMSPFCPVRTLAECPSPQADKLRLWILTQASAGASRPELEQMLLERYGDEILSAPRAQGWGLSAYLIPVAGFLAGGVLVAIFLRRFVRAPGAEADPVAPGEAADADPELERLVDEELASR